MKPVLFLATLIYTVSCLVQSAAQSSAPTDPSWKTQAKKLQLAESPAAIANRAEADIPAYFTDAYELLRQYPPYLTGSSPQDDGGRAKAITSNIRDMLNYMSATLQMARHTDDSDLLSLGGDLYDTLLARLLDRSNVKREEQILDQNTIASLAMGADILNAEGQLDGKRKTGLAELAVFIAKRRYDTWPEPNLSDASEILAAYSGAANLARIFPDMPELKTLRAHSQAHFDALLARGNIDTSHSLKSAYGLCSLIHTAQTKGRFDDLTALRPTFEHYRDLLPPSGYIPRFGRDDWRVSPMWIPILLAGEALFGDGTYRYAAEKAFAIYRHHQAANHRRKIVLKGYDAHYLLCLLDFPAFSADPVAPTTLSQRIGDKVVLRNGHGPDATQLFLDLNPSADATPDRRPAIAGYESARVIHSRGTDRNLLHAQSGNLLLMMKEGLPFPFPPAKMQEIQDAERERLFRYDYWDPKTGGRFTDHLDVGDITLTNKDGEAHASIHFPVYGTADTSLHRRIIITAEGVVVIRDDLSPGESANRMSAGSLWSTEANGDESLDAAVHQSPAETFSDADTDTQRQANLLVVHAKLDGAETGTAGSAVNDDWLVTKASRGATITGTTAYSKVKLKKGQPQTFLTVLVPFPNSVKAPTAEEAVKAGQSGEDDIRVTVRRQLETLRVEMKANGEWTAKRFPNAF